ncbi:uncharacterized protein RHOBADRAFT_48765 [Rhodotorula graminis WP1]|uniref:Uncharacterized protein n=1 Tax=Rhodotorula graminis (strain WP1) TaxID=578459 RepID=A0A0P9FDD9_RHOGW|nr:uncharacterized protein RHOBADRAFT_48765 [Rhodotorula graminis WP1]KPV73767.1 hypothetical protein RHOBADRAFT_48765 [Rhodotorula graminis WP1]
MATQPGQAPPGLSSDRLRQVIANGTNPHPDGGPASASAAAPAPDASAPPQAPASPSTVPFTPEQVAALKCQVVAFRLLARNQPIPPALQAALATPQDALKFAAKLPDSATTLSGHELSPEAAAEERERALAAEPPLDDVEDADSLVYPYNAFLTPRDILTAFHGTASRRPLLIPNLLPAGLDPQAVIDERNRFIDARILQRRRELEELPANLPSPSSSSSSSSSSLASQKVRALVELKSLRLLERQRALREQVVHGLKPACSLALPLDRTLFRRVRKPSLADARQIEQLERKQKLERERRAKQKHLDHLSDITEHGRHLVEAHRAHEAKFHKLGKALLKFHVDAEKEEQKRVERVSKERLKALRADDEEGYLKLIDTAKDTRITHLLRQTDSFLESLAAAVSAQQSEARAEQDQDVLDEQTAGADGAVDESRFGAQPVFADEAKDKVDYYNVAHRVKETITQQPSILVGGELKGYQLKGLEWMVSLYNNHVNGILADEMGLGKTIQTLSLITYLIETKRQPGPYLVIVPLSTMPNWISEFERWAPSVKVVSYKGTPAQRKGAQAEIRHGNFQVLLTTFEYIIKDRPLLAKVKWLHMIIDEGHRMKNTQSKLSVTLTQYYSSRYRLILTGTPLQNNLPELWALLNFVLPKIFGSVKSFDEWFNAPFANTGGQDKIELNEEESLLVIRRLHKVLRPFLLRRLKKDVEQDLPDKVERVIKCKMSALQRELTKQIKEHGMIFTEAATSDKKNATGIRGLQNQIMQLRKICNHPFCFEAVERSIDPTGMSNATLYRVAGKFELLDRILPKLFATGHRVLMFFQMTTVMTIFEDYLNFRRIEHLRLDGTTKHEDRSTLLKLFNDPASKYPIFILSTRAGGLGLNLQSADTVIIFDSDWNPHQDLQAQDRAHRIGQKKEVRILRLVTERSVEEHVMAGAARKIEMDKKIIQAGRYDNKSTAEERDAFLRALLEAEDGGEADPDADDDADEADALNEAIARTEDERVLFAQMDRDRRASEERAWAAAGHTGKLPERLIQEWELPEVYRMEHAKIVHSRDESPADGARRNRTQVTYDDGLSEEQWLQTMEDDGDGDGDDAASSSKKRGGGGKRRAAAVAATANRFGYDDGTGASASASGYPSDSDDGASSVAASRQRLKRGRESVGATPSVNGDDVSRVGGGGGAGGGGGGKRRKVLSPYQEKLRECFEELLTEVENLDNVRPRLSLSHSSLEGLALTLGLCPLAADDGPPVCRRASHALPLSRPRGPVTDPHAPRPPQLFNELPSKRDYPDYYLLITHPISLKEIKKKVNNGTYPNTDAFATDIHQMLNNAMTYNEEGSVVYEDARMLRDVFNRAYVQVTYQGQPVDPLPRVAQRT